MRKGRFKYKNNNFNIDREIREEELTIITIHTHIDTHS